MAKMTGGQAITASLKAQGVDTVFGIISVHTLDLFDALFDNQDSLRLIGGRLELGCGYMADGYYRATGKPGVLLTSTGPGAADSVGALGEAYFSGSAVLEITTNVEQEFVNGGRLATHETKDQLGMFRAVTDWNAMINQIESIPDHLVEAFQRFQTRRPRPIELEIPTDLLGQQAEVEVLGPRTAEIPQGDPGMVEKALDALLQARRPVIFVGEEVLSLGGTQEIVQLAEMLGAPVVTGDGGKGAFPEDHPLSLGQALGQRIWGENPLQEWLGTCDVALVLGSVLSYRTTVGVGMKLPRTVIHVLMDGDIIGKNYETAIPIVGQSRAVVRQLLDGIGDRDVYKGEAFRSEVESMREQIYENLKDQWGNEVRTFEAIRAATPRDTIFSLDATVAASRASRCLPIYQPRTFMHPHGWAGLGFGFPAALGAKVGKPESPVVCITGDGGFQYNFQELATAAQYGIHPIVLMFNDNAWGVLKGRQEEGFNGRIIGTDLVNPDFVKLFESYGFGGTKVTTVAQLAQALEDAVAADKVHLIEAQIPQGFGAFE
ncbi:MAG: thiamine pyrophosphate-binding protein [Chloroflexi bacterium]|nr:thiamine pyrophosphate-binding protein [Chloroflexota bacterium]MCI0867489.1 thiamine pyrophosphate-binding protein [Chloroflexota bacterium]